MKKIFIICVMILSYHISNAQNKISGKIKDQDNIPLAGASVFINDMNKGTISNSYGAYELTDLPNGKIKIQFSSIGYTSHIETVELNGKSIEINVTLSQTVIEMEGVVVTGGYNSTQHENAVKIDVLKLDPLKITNTPNFMEVITKVPGIDMISKGSGVSKPVIRGLSMNDILVLNNGVRFENYQYSSHHPLGIDEFGIENVEIIKGPASLLYGSDAIGGVINFIKEKPAPIGSVVGDFNMQLFSNTLGMTNNLGIKGASKKFFGGIRVGQKTNSDFLQGGGNFVPNSRFNEISFKANAGFTDKIGTFKLFYDFNNQKLGLVEDEAIEEITERSRKNEIFYQELNTHLLSSQNKLYLGKFKLDVNSSFQNTELIHFGEANEYEIQMELATLTYDAKLHLPSKENSEYIIGFQGFNQTNTNLNDRETKLLPDATTNNYSAFGLLQYTFFKKLKLQTGVRYDNKTITTQAIGLLTEPDYRASLSKSYGSFSGSLGTTYNVSETLLFRTNFAAAYRTPNLAELTSNGQHELRYEIGDPDLVPENSYEADLSMHYHKDNFTFDIAGFYNIVDNYIFISPTDDTTTSGIDIFKYKQSNSTLFGGEAGLHIHPKSLKWLHFESTFSSVIGKQENGDFLPFVPAHKLRFELRGEKEKLMFLRKAFISVNTCTAFNQNNAAPDETATTCYTLVDISLGGNIKMKNQFISLSISANNIFDTKYIDHLSTLKEVNLYNPGRNISLNLKIPFGVKMENKE
ncbi:MAG: TonB-dependent receptor [Bacteroidales bacterium]|nr:TonB-dependent receptor [Bacteroidales bacterium]MCF8404793.1 TonB-dependent receptor [Bacteroidales bacterium]